MVRVREVTLTDDLSSLVKAIDTASWVEASEIEKGDYTEASLARCASNEHQVFCVATLGEQFVGMASAFVLQKPSGESLLYIDEVDVCADKQKKGVGTALMKFLFEWGTEKGCTENWLGTEKDNVAANALYKSLHPKEVEEFVGYLFK